MTSLLHLQDSASGGNAGGVFIAIPSYGPIPAPVAYAMVSTERELRANGFSVEWAIMSGHCHVDDARNELVAEFLRGGCDDLMFIDADVQWRASELIRLLGYARDVVGGAYRKKQTDEDYPVRPLPGAMPDHDGLIEVDGLPGGFLRIYRPALLKLANQATWYDVQTHEGGRVSVPLIFERMVRGRQRFSGDYAFCKKWRDIGGRIYLDPTLRFAHIGEQSWTGSYGAWRNRKSGDILNGLKQIAAGTETPETYELLYDEWDNDGFAATPEFLMAAVWMAREKSGPILETGSGLTTLCMAAANPAITVHALEHSQQWAERVLRLADRFDLDNIVMHVAPLADHVGRTWYDTITLPDADWAMVVCDGPPRAQGDRSVLFDAVHINGCPILMDDANDPRQMAALGEWSDDNGRTVTTMGKMRLFAVSTKGQACAT